jgi:hypothetical protein
MSNVFLFKPEPGDAPRPLTADEAFKRDNIEAEAFVRQKAELLRGKAPTAIECQAEVPTTCDWCNRRSLRHNPLLRCRTGSEDAFDFVHVACWPYWYARRHVQAVAALEKAGIKVPAALKSRPKGHQEYALRPIDPLLSLVRAITESVTGEGSGHPIADVSALRFTLQHALAVVAAEEERLLKAHLEIV